MNDAEMDFEKESEKWSPLIGKYILVFGDIERSIHDVISYHLRESLIDVKDISLTLEKKIDLFDRILREKCVDDRLSKKLSLVVKLISKLIQTRHLLAHNGLSLSLEEGLSGDFRLVQFEIVSHKNKAGINLKELSAKLKELEQCRILILELLLPLYEAQWKRSQVC